MSPQNQPSHNPSFPATPAVTRRQALLGGIGAAGLLLTGAGVAGAQSAEGQGPIGGMSIGSSSGALNGATSGLLPAELEVVTVTTDSVTFYWNTYNGPRLPYGGRQDTVDADTEVLLGGTGIFDRLEQVHYDATPRPHHLVTIDGLQPGREYAFECRSGGVKATSTFITTSQTWSPERRGRFTTLTAPRGEKLATLAILNDTHIGTGTHNDGNGLILAAALEQVKAHKPDFLLVNGDCTDSNTPEQVAEFWEIMNGYGTYQVDWAVTRGNHDGPRGDGDAWGQRFVPREQLWTQDLRGFRILGVDSGDGDSEGHIGQTQLDAIGAELQQDPERPTLVFTHHPATWDSRLASAGVASAAMNMTDARILREHLAAAPGVFFAGAGHTHRAKRTVSVAAAGVDFVETGASGRFPSGYSVLQLHTGGYQLNFHRTAGDDVLAAGATKRWEVAGLLPEYALGVLEHRSYTVARDIDPRAGLSSQLSSGAAGLSS